MTNYRLVMNEDDLEQFKFCFTCGSPIIKAKNNTFTCSKSWIHIRISIDNDIEEIIFN